MIDLEIILFEENISNKMEKYIKQLIRFFLRKYIFKHPRTNISFRGINQNFFLVVSG